MLAGKIPISILIASESNAKSCYIATPWTVQSIARDGTPLAHSPAAFFIGQDWQAYWAKQGIHVWTTKRENQRDQNPPEFDRLLNHVRERIEGAFDILKEGGRSVEHTLTVQLEDSAHGLSPTLPE